LRLKEQKRSQKLWLVYNCQACISNISSIANDVIKSNGLEVDETSVDQHEKHIKRHFMAVNSGHLQM
jgi:hypothetical protein